MTAIDPMEGDPKQLAAVVRKVCNQPEMILGEWKAIPLHAGMEWDSAVIRYQGNGRVENINFPWSVILKVIHPNEKSLDPQGIWYWKREALAYQTGLVYQLPGGQFSAPGCYGIVEKQDGSIWMWLEDLQDDGENPWTVADYARVAKHLGLFNGAYLAGQEFPAEEWVSHNWLRKYLENAKSMVEFIRQNPDHPLIKHMFPGGTLAQVLAMWDERHNILNKLEGLPQTFCHQDAFRRNLFSRSGKTYAIDWGYLGIAPVGAELVALVAASISFFEIPVEKVKELDRLCFEGYVQGLREAGWDGNPRQVRTGYALSLMLRYPIAGQIGEVLPTLLDQEGRTRMEKAFEDKTADQLEKSDPALVAYYEGILPEAMKLLGWSTLLRLAARIIQNSLWLFSKQLSRSRRTEISPINQK